MHQSVHDFLDVKYSYLSTLRQQPDLVVCTAHNISRDCYAKLSCTLPCWPVPPCRDCTQCFIWLCAILFLNEASGYHNKANVPIFSIMGEPLVSFELFFYWISSCQWGLSILPKVPGFTPNPTAVARVGTHPQLRELEQSCHLDRDLNLGGGYISYQLWWIHKRPLTIVHHLSYSGTGNDLLIMYGAFPQLLMCNSSFIDLHGTVQNNS